MTFIATWYQRTKKHVTPLKRLVTLPNFIIFIGVLTALIYLFSYLFPFTDNAFVVNNVRPVAAQVNGYITHLYVKNGDYVHEGQKLFTVFKPPYEYNVARLQAELASARANFLVLQTTFERDQKISENKHKIFIKLDQDDKKYHKGYANRSISLIQLQNSEQETKAAKDTWQAALKQLEIDQYRMEAQKKDIDSLIAQLRIAEVDLQLTEVIAHQNGVVQNLFFTKGTPINRNQPLFSLVNTDELYIQANFNETDLRDVQNGSRALIFPRMYLGRKMFHGVVDSNYWAANRQQVDLRSQLQNVTNENQWILLPQRLPVIIRITDPDPKYPLSVGSSAYVYIRTG
ncbi:HlyD family secretion protein [Legionella spiritensis]|uniref:HlyD family secretion protein n=1 Tax=Legionella spiritensis TaxID=452 RepID=UPI000F6FE69B|nr:HlyD family secretion protein [Legionella spiritensis]VEG91816.1 multidrug resistance efflux pump PmrA [Legionella spiritensis]